MPFTLPSTDNRPVTVLGGGVLGRRIATVWAAGGYDVHIRDPSEQQRKDAETYLNENIDVYCRKTNVKPGRLTTFADLKTAVEKSWLVVECVPEHLEIKVDTFADLEKLAPQDAILLTNSSSYKSGEMLEKVNDQTKQRIGNSHYMMPPQARVVELMTCGHTDPVIFPFLVERLQRCAMIPFVAKKESSGFIFNRIWAAIKREILGVIAEGVATPEDVDSIWKEMYVNNPMGPCEMMDGVGLDTVAFIEEHYVKERGLSPKNTVDYLQSEFISNGKLGNKSDKGGFYPNKHVHDAVDATQKKKGAPTLYFLDIGLNAPQDPLHSGRIVVADADGKSTKTVLDHLSLPDGLDIYEDRLYWTNMGLPPKNDGTVMSAKLDGSDVKEVVPKGSVHTPKQISVDATSKKLYFCDREGMRVMRVNFDGSELETLVRTGDFNKPEEQQDLLRHCVGVTVDAQSGYFYWTQKGPSKGNQGRIFRAHTDMPSGQTPDNRKDIQLVFEKLPEPIDLELHDGHLYWTDRGEIPLGNSINRVALKDVQTGSASEHKHQVISHNLHEAIGLKLDAKNKHIYATDLGGTVYRFNLDGTHKVKLIDEEAAYSGITLKAA